MSDPILDVVAFVSVKLHASGAMSISGNIGDTALAVQMLDHARDAVRNQRRPQSDIIVPNRDVVAPQSPAYPTLPFGDMRPEDRGDLPASRVA